MTSEPVWKRWEIRTGATIAVAVAVPFFTHSVEWTPSLKDDLALGAAIWVVGMLFQIAYSIHCFTVDRLKIKNFIDAIDDHDRLLLQLQAAFRQLLSRHHDGRTSSVFVDYCRRHLERSLDVAATAAQRGRLQVSDHHFETVEAVLGAFRDCPDRTFRCVWLVEPDNMFDDYWRQYVESLISLSRKRSAAERVRVRILFVYGDAADLRAESVRTVLGFMAAEVGFEYAVMTADAYKRRLRDGNLESDTYVDFGVYGDRLLYRTKSYDPVVGEFCDDETMIRNYRRVHDNAMTAGVRFARNELPVNVTDEQFLSCDRSDR